MKIKRRMLEALAGIQNFIRHGVNTNDCPACPRWDELQSAVMEAIAALEAAEARIAELEEALKLADAALEGANMNMNVVKRKVKAALAKEGA